MSALLRHRYLIVGQGIAGSLLAWKMLLQGAAVYVVNSADPHSASRVSAGLFSSMTGPGLAKPWLWDEAYPQALQCYRELSDFFHTKPFLSARRQRVLLDHRTRKAFVKRQKDTSFDGLWEHDTNTFDSSLNEQIKAPFGSFSVNHSYELDTVCLLDHIEDHLTHQGRLLKGSWAHPQSDADLRLLSDPRSDPLLFNKHLSDQLALASSLPWQVIFCEGYGAVSNPLFSWLPFRFTKGEAIIIEVTDGPDLQGVILKYGHWCIPLHQGEEDRILRRQQYYVGATYENPANTIASPTGRDQLLSQFQEVLPTAQKISLLEHRVGVRPTTIHHRPILGIHPCNPNFAIFNGLGSKGSLWAPYLTDLLVDHLNTGATLPCGVTDSLEHPRVEGVPFLPTVSSSLLTT